MNNYTHGFSGGKWYVYSPNGSTVASCKTKAEAWAKAQELNSI